MAREKVQRITIKSLMDAITPAVLLEQYLLRAGIGNTIPVFRLAMILSEAKSAAFDDSVEFKGVIHALNLLSTKMHAGTSLVFPNPFRDYLAGIISAGPLPCELAIEARAMCNGNKQTEWSIAVLLEPRKSDQMAALFASVPAFHESPGVLNKTPPPLPDNPPAPDDPAERERLAHAQELADNKANALQFIDSRKAAKKGRR